MGEPTLDIDGSPSFNDTRKITRLLRHSKPTDPRFENFKPKFYAVNDDHGKVVGGREKVENLKQLPEDIIKHVLSFIGEARYNGETELDRETREHVVDHYWDEKINITPAL